MRVRSPIAKNILFSLVMVVIGISGSVFAQTVAQAERKDTSVNAAPSAQTVQTPDPRASTTEPKPGGD